MVKLPSIPGHTQTSRIKYHGIQPQRPFLSVINRKDSNLWKDGCYPYHEDAQPREIEQAGEKSILNIIVCFCISFPLK